MANTLSAPSFDSGLPMVYLAAGMSTGPLDPRPSTLDPLRVVGVDPGLVTTGYGVIEGDGRQARLLEGGVIEGGPADIPVEERLLALYRGMEEVLKEFRPQAMALEALYSHYAHPATAILMGHARGVLCLAAAQAGIPTFHYTATQVKDYLVGSGRASKTQIQRMVQKELGLKEAPSPHDVADALAVALCHCRLAASPLVRSLRPGGLRPQGQIEGAQA